MLTLEKDNIKQILKLLKGQYLVDLGRSLNLVWFIFDDKENRSGKFALHVQSSWRLTKDNKIICGSGDIYETLPDVEYTAWDIIGNSKFDFITGGHVKPKLPLKVMDVFLDGFNGIQMSFSNEYKLDVYVDSATPIEHWRFINLNTGEHFVLYDVEI